MKILYMHLLNGNPAYFEAARQIVYARISYRGRGLQEGQLCHSFSEVKAQQKASKKFRKDKGWWRKGDEKNYYYIPLFLN